MGKNTYRHYNLNAPDKKVLNIDTFRGVDYTPAQLNVADFHAVDIQNIVWKDKVDQKRNGLEHCGIVPIVYYYDENFVSKNNKDSREINGFYEFMGEDGFNVMLVHAGKLLFVVSRFGKGYPPYNAKWELVATEVVKNGVSYTVAKELNNTISQGFIGSHRLYLLDGEKYRVIRYKNRTVTIEDVEDNALTYVPTTTIGIGISWKDKSSADEPYKVYSPSSPTPLDDVNLLTQWRKNKLVSGLFLEGQYSLRITHFNDYELDTNIKPKINADINDIIVQINELGGE